MLASVVAISFLAAMECQAGIILIGNEVWRNSQEAEGQGIALEFLSGKTVYAKMKPQYSHSVNARTVRTVCGSKEANGLGERLFDADEAFCNDPNVEDNFQVVGFTFDSEGLVWNHYLIILQKSVADSIDNKILKIQMGNAITREPPKLLGVFDKSDTCKDDGNPILRASNKIICNGWSWKDLHEQYWGKEVPPEIKALNGTGVKTTDQSALNTGQVAQPIVDSAVEVKPQ